MRNRVSCVGLLAILVLLAASSLSVGAVVTFDPDTYGSYYADGSVVRYGNYSFRPEGGGHGDSEHLCGHRKDGEKDPPPAAAAGGREAGRRRLPGGGNTPVDSNALLPGAIGTFESRRCRQDRWTL